jgi:glycosyltransferase involved in cell wall biosynthesis
MRAGAIMRIAIVHYHLQTGGVGRVVQHACTALLGRGEQVVVLSGTAPQVSLPQGTELAVLPGLEYEERREAQTPDQLAATMTTAATAALGGPPDLWHVHNHCLGKNTALPGALLRLARNGHRLLLQPHDFAEDGRPALYRRLREQLAGGNVGRLSALLYPLAPNIHYATLNDRDRRFLAGAGVPEEQLHPLPNAVSMGMPVSESPERATAPGRGNPRERLWLYPTRAIRRKNLGEFLLWAALSAERDAEEQDRFAVTQAPQNPRERPIYEQWVSLARELDLPVRFEAGGGDLDFPSLIASSHALVTTSVAEGFGLAFLEPWLLGRPLVGRDLPEITADFVAEGVCLPGLYQRLDVPLAWVDEARLRDAFERAARQRADAYGRKPGDAAERAWASAVADGRIDFGRLNEPAQTTIIRRVHADPSAGQALRPQGLDASAAESVIESNLGVIDRRYSLEGFGQRLAAIYAAVAGSTPSATFSAADGEALLQHFLDPRRLTLLRT